LETNRVIRDYLIATGNTMKTIVSLTRLS